MTLWDEQKLDALFSDYNDPWSVLFGLAARDEPDAVAHLFSSSVDDIVAGGGGGGSFQSPLPSHALSSPPAEPAAAAASTAGWSTHRGYTPEAFVGTDTIPTPIRIRMSTPIPIPIPTSILTGADGSVKPRVEAVPALFARNVRYVRVGGMLRAVVDVALALVVQAVRGAYARQGPLLGARARGIQDRCFRDHAGTIPEGGAVRIADDQGREHAYADPPFDDPPHSRHASPLAYTSAGLRWLVQYMCAPYTRRLQDALDAIRRSRVVDQICVRIDASAFVPVCARETVILAVPDRRSRPTVLVRDTSGGGGGGAHDDAWVVASSSDNAPRSSVRVHGRVARALVVATAARQRRDGMTAFLIVDKVLGPPADDAATFERALARAFAHPMREATAGSGHRHPSPLIIFLSV